MCNVNLKRDGIFLLKLVYISWFQFIKEFEEKFVQILF